MSQINTRLPVKRASAPPPALWQQAAPAVIRATALVAAGVIGQWAIRSMARKAVSAPLSLARGDSKPRAVASRDDGVIAISETVVMRRRTIIKR